MVKKYYSLHQLRALAALLVVISHIPITNRIVGSGIGGFAVCIFFILSGFLLVHTTKESTECYLVKRIIRIVPLYYIFITFTYIIFLLKPNFFHSVDGTLLNLFKSFFFIPYVNSSGIVRPILDVGWAILPEIWFSIIYFIVYKLCYKKRFIITVTIILNIGILFFIFRENYSIFNQYWQSCIYFSIGMIINMFYKENFHEFPNSNLNNLILNNLNYFIFLFLGVFYSKILLIGYSFISFFIPTICFLYFLLIDNKYNLDKFSVLLSRISYSLFLSHQFVIKGIDRLIYNINNISFISIILMTFSIMFSIWCAYNIYNYVEKVITRFLKNLLLGR